MEEIEQLLRPAFVICYVIVPRCRLVRAVELIPTTFYSSLGIANFEQGFLPSCAFTLELEIFSLGRTSRFGHRLLQGHAVLVPQGNDSISLLPNSIHHLFLPLLSLVIWVWNLAGVVSIFYKPLDSFLRSHLFIFLIIESGSSTLSRSI